VASFSVTIARLTVHFDLPGHSWLAPLLPRLGKFQADAGAVADLSCEVRLEQDLALAPGGEPRVEQEDDGLHLRHDNFHGHLPPTGQAKLVIVQPGDTPVDATYTMVIDSFLRLALAQLLAARGGLMLHAAGISTDPDAGYVFFGPSGSGKTTICRLSSPRYRILCDEIIAIRPGPEGDRLYGTPFNGAWGDSLNEDVPLRELFYLRQANHTGRVSLSTHEAARALLESAVAYHREPEFIGHLLDVALDLIKRVPITQLNFIAKETLWETVLAPTR
jgi:hypothetical protein